MARIEDAPKIRKLLKKRKKAIAKLRTLEMSNLKSVKVSFETTDEEQEQREEIKKAWDAWGVGYVMLNDYVRQNNAIKIRVDETVKEFLVQHLYDVVAEIDGKLFDLGFQFPDNQTTKKTRT